MKKKIKKYKVTLEYFMDEEYYIDAKNEKEAIKLAKELSSIEKPTFELAEEVYE